MKNLLKKALSLVLALMIVVTAIPFAPFSAAAAEDNRVVDPSTMNTWTTFFPDDSTDHAGAIWTDKSVFKDASAFNGLVTMDNSKDNFLVALSTLAANKSIEGYSHIPTDTVLVLDMSSSMNGSVDELVVATNSAINELMQLNNYNRVAVVLYSGNDAAGWGDDDSNAKVLLPLDHYTLTQGSQYLTNPRSNRIEVSSNVRNSENNTPSSNQSSTSTGTFIQSGIYEAMNVFLSVPSEDTKITGNGPQSGVSRLPILVLMSDGEATLGTTEYAGKSNNPSQIGSTNMNFNNYSDDAIYFLTQLTAAYAKKKIDAHYAEETPLFYTLGFNMGSGDDLSVLNPSNSNNNVDELWEDYIALAANANMRVGNNRFIQKNSLLTSADDQNYVNGFYSASGNGLTTAFDDIVKQIILQSLYYPTLVETNVHDMDGYIEFYDDLGEYLEVKSIKGVRFGDRLYTGELLAQNFRPGGGNLGTVENPNEMGDTMVQAVVKRLGIDQVTDSQGNLRFPTHESQIQEARTLVGLAYRAGQLSYESATKYSNYIGWYADADGQYIGFWEEGHDQDDRPANAVYINKSYGMLGTVDQEHRDSDMMFVSIQVHTNISNGHSAVIWRIPASLIPVVTYEVSLENDTLDNPGEISVDFKENDPISLIFEVGLRSDINVYNIEEKVGTNNRNPDGTYTFYTNRWDLDDFNDPSNFPSEEINAVVFYEPSEENERYYYNENTTIFKKVGNVYEPYQGTVQPEHDGEYYRRYHVFEKQNNVWTLNWKYELISEAALRESLSYGDATQQWYIPKGTIHRMYTNFRYYKGNDLGNGNYSNNLTETLPYSHYGTVEHHADANLSDGDDSYYYVDVVLGNNGLLKVTPAQGIIIEKNVDDTITNLQRDYTFTVTKAGVTGTYDTLHVDADGNETEGTVEFVNGTATITLRANEKMYIVGLDTGDYIVAEAVDATADYIVKSASVNGVQVVSRSVDVTVPVVANELSTVNFVNGMKTENRVYISKNVVHDLGADYNVTKKFTITVTLGAAYANADIELSSSAITGGGTTTVTADANGAFTYDIAHGETISFDAQEGTLIHIDENSYAGFTPVITFEENRDTVASDNGVVAMITNTYEPTKVYPVNVSINGTKTLVGREWLANDEFEFVLEKYDFEQGFTQVGASVTVDRNTPDHKFDLSAQLASVEFTEVGTYYFRVRELYTSDPYKGVDYDNVVWIFEVEVGGGDMEGALVIKDVRRNTGTVEYNAGTNQWTLANMNFTNRYAPSGSSTVTVNIEKDVIDLSNAWSGGLKDFEFGLYASDGSLIGQTVKTDVNGHANIQLTYTALDLGPNFTSQTFTYTVKEIEGAAPGMQYTDETQTVNVYVYDKLDGTIGAIIYQGSNRPASSDSVEVSFTNVYDPSAATATISGHKNLVGKNLTAGEFTFELYEVADGNYTITNNSVRHQTTNDANGNFVFHVYGLDQVKDYYFVLKEVPGTENGMNYSTEEYKIRVTVSDSGSGSLVATITEINGETNISAMPIQFTNVFVEKNVYVEKDDELLPNENNFVTVGDELYYEIVFTNPENTALDVTVRDQIPDGTQFVPGSGVVDVNGSARGIDPTVSVSGELTWSIEDLPVGATLKVSFKLLVLPEAEGELENQALVNNYETESVHNHVIKKDVSDSQADVGDTLDYVIFWSNNHTYVSTVEIIDQLDPGLEFISASHDGIYNAATHTITWRLQNVAAHGKGSVTFKAKVRENAGSNIANTAIVNNATTNTKETEVLRPGLVVEKTQKVNNGAAVNTELTVKAGDLITYIIKVTNNGDGVAENLVITDAIPTSSGYTMTFHSANNGGQNNNGTVTWHISELAAGNSLEVSFTAEVPETNGEVHWANVATVTYDNDPDDTPDKSNEVKLFEGYPEVTVKKEQALNNGAFTDQLIEVTENDRITYQITVSNNGTEEATGVVVTDTVPAGLVVDPTSISHNGVYTNGVITWQIGNLAENSSVALTFNVVVPQVDSFTKWTNSVSTNIDNGEDPDPSNVTIVYPTNEFIYGEKKFADNSHPYILVGSDFEFVLTTTQPNAPMPQQTTVTNDAQGIFAFGPIVFDTAGTYTYTISEVEGNINGMEYDADDVTVTVTVVEKTEAGKVSYEVQSITYSTGTRAVFTNTYDPVDAVVSLETYKELVNGVFDARDFGFELYEIDPTGQPVLKQTVYNDEDGDILFEDLVFDTVGDYEYEIVEIVGTQSNIIYSETVHKVFIEVTDNNGVLNASVTIDGTPVTTEGEIADALAFVNGTIEKNAYAQNNGNALVQIDGDMVQAGSEVIYEIVVPHVNAGLAEITIVDTIPAGTTYKENSAVIRINGVETDDAVFTFADNKLTWTIEDVQTGDEVSVSFAVVVDLISSGVVKNQADVEIGNNDYQTNVVTNVINRKAADKAAASVGDKIVYTIDWYNMSGTIADVIVKDALDEGLDFVAPAGAQTDNGFIRWTEGDNITGVYDIENHEVTWTVANAAVNASGSVTLETKVNAKAGDDVANKAFVNETWSNEVIVDVLKADLTVEKAQKVNDANALNNAKVEAGDKVTYLITVSNNGEGDVKNVTIMDTLPTSGSNKLALIEGTVSEGGTVEGDQITWIIDRIAAGDSVTVEFSVRVPEVSVDTTWRNIAQIVIDSDEDGENDVDPDDSNEVVVREDIVEISDDEPPATGGESLVGLWLALFFVSGTVLFTAFFVRKKEEQE